jgi:hypothetical protein
MDFQLLHSNNKIKFQRKIQVLSKKYSKTKKSDLDVGEDGHLVVDVELLAVAKDLSGAGVHQSLVRHVAEHEPFRSDELQTAPSHFSNKALKHWVSKQKFGNLTIKPDSKQDHFPNYSWKIVRKDDQIRF